MDFLTKKNEEKLALAASMISSFNAFLAGDLMPSGEITPDVNQVVEEDLDKLDVAWNMAMSAFKADKFAKRYGRRPMYAYPGMLKDRLSNKVTNTEAETETKTEPVNKPAEEMKESPPNSDSVENTNCSSLCAESVRTEEKSKEDDESHQSAADNTDESGAIILDYACDKNDYVENAENVENNVAGEPDVSSKEFETSVSNKSENNSDDSENCTKDSGISDNELKSSSIFDCDDQSESSSIAKEDSQTILDTDNSSSELPESSNVESSEADLTEEEKSIESNYAETYGNMKTMEKESIEINSTVESDDETVEEIVVETFSADSSEDMVSKENENVKVTSTDSSFIDPKSDLNKTESTESVPRKRKRSRRNRRLKRKNAKRENPNLKQTEPKLKGKVADTYSCADTREPGSSKNKHPQKHSVSNEWKRRDQFSRITQAELDVFFLKKADLF
ncbi:histone-lysine N-methyltransferase, H3 lysine-79 specific-like [Helianthus annuus]|uniref:histone-lysine N-methyltransferase, H3 lysine-79 specific-like n=1 Tax=Helianthus annuus TaxID=4232 RepID=UPI000B903E6F|nr:histone-lysine N-methyltransferase, H3 lysine-79 specific-like [Helianthus annuus]